MLNSVWHGATLRLSPAEGDFHYSNTFTAFPFALPFRPAQVTPKPNGQRHSDRIVVGPAGQEIFTDKYGRVKVQFHWDREGQKDANSSCWVRVLQPTAAIAGDPPFGLASARKSWWILRKAIRTPRSSSARSIIPTKCRLIWGMVQILNTRTTTRSAVSRPARPWAEQATTSCGSTTPRAPRRFTSTASETSIFGSRRGQPRKAIGNNRHLIVGEPSTKWDKTGNQMELIYQDKSIQVKSSTITRRRSTGRSKLPYRRK